MGDNDFSMMNNLNEILEKMNECESQNDLNKCMNELFKFLDSMSNVMKTYEFAKKKAEEFLGYLYYRDQEAMLVAMPPHLYLSFNKGINDKSLYDRLVQYFHDDSDKDRPYIQLFPRDIDSFYKISLDIFR